MFTRAKYQHGSVVREARKNGPDVWVLRWRDSQPDGKVVRRKQIIGTVKEYSESSAWKACERTRLTINRETATPRTVAELTAHYTERKCQRTATNRSPLARHTVAISITASCQRGENIRLQQLRPWLLKSGCTVCNWPLEPKPSSETSCPSSSRML